MSLAIVFVFILCHSVKWIPNLYELARLAREDKTAWPPWVESVTHVSHFLMTVNCSVNFYIYCFKHYAGGRLRWLLPCCCFCLCCAKHDGGSAGAGAGGGGAGADSGANALTAVTEEVNLTTVGNAGENDEAIGRNGARRRGEESGSLLADLRFSFRRTKMRGSSPIK